MKWLFVLYTAVVVILLCGCAKEPAPVQTEVIITEGMDGIPTINAEIVNFRSSPDYSHVALVLEQANTLDPAKNNFFWVAIFDPAKKEIVAQTPKPGRYWRTGLFWSPDGKWLAVADHINDERISLLGTDGTYRESVSDMDVDETTNGHVYDLVWREDMPGRFLYLKSHERDNVYEYDVDSDSENLHRVQYSPIRLFSVNGKPCVGYYKDPPNYDPAKADALYAAEFHSGKVIAEIPLYTLNTESIYEFDVSPDGKYFFLVTGYSHPTRYSIARTLDAETVLGNPHEAVLWQDDASGDFTVTWHRKAVDQAGVKRDDRMALVQGGPRFSLDLITGSRYSWYYPGIRLVDRWKRTEWTDSSGDRRTADHLVLDEEGLSIRDLSLERFGHTKPMLRHRLQERD